MDNAQRAFIADKQLQALMYRYDTNQHGVNTTANIDDHSDAQKNEADFASALSMQAIVNAVLQPMLSASQQTRKQVNTSLLYYRWYKQVLNATTGMQSYSQAAANSRSSDDIYNTLAGFTRRGEGFVINIIQEAPGLQTIPKNQRNEQDVSNESDHYIVVTLDNIAGDERKKALFLHCEYMQTIHVVKLSHTKSNTFQALLSSTDSALHAIAHEESHLYLT